MKNKKGFLLGEYTLKIIIAIMSLSLLVYLLFSVYVNVQKDKDMKQAEADLNKIFEKMSLAKDKGPQKLTLVSPNKWYLNFFKKGEERPNECLENCLCICSIFTCETKKRKCKEVNEDIEVSSILHRKIFSDKKVSNIKLPADINIKFNRGKFLITKNEN